MTWPDPRPGLVIRYSYLWRLEAEAGREEGVKDRPCAIIIAIDTDDDEKMVYALPITHTPPSHQDEAIELPKPTKARLGLDGDRSWIVISEGNSFVWPGPDLRFPPDTGPKGAAYGMLPPAVFNVVKQRFLRFVRDKRVRIVARTE